MSLSSGAALLLIDVQQGLDDPPFKVEALPMADEPVFQKHVNSAFIGTDLEAHLRAHWPAFMESSRRSDPPRHRDGTSERRVRRSWSRGSRLDPPRN